MALICDGHLSVRVVDLNERNWRASNLRFLLVAIFAVPGKMAYAGVFVSALLVSSPPDVPFNFPEEGLRSPWVAYQLCMCGTNGDEIGAVDVTITGNKLLQRWRDNDFDGVVDPSPVGVAYNGRGDSHLTPPAGSPFGFGPSETNTKTGSPLTSIPGTVEYGLGDLAGAWAILNPSPVNNIAYIVLKNGDLPNLSVTIRSATPKGAPLPTVGLDFFISGTPNVFSTCPEPASLVYAGIWLFGGCGLVRRRLN